MKEGDFVLVHGVKFIAEILATNETSFGYRSFFVRFLKERPVHDIAEDWVLANQVRKLYSREELMKSINDQVVSDNEEMGAFIHDVFANSSPDLAQQALRETLTDLWDAGLRDYYHSGHFLHDLNQNAPQAVS